MLDDRAYMRGPDWRPEAPQGGVSWCLKLIIINVICFVLQHTIDEFGDGLRLGSHDLKQLDVWQLLTFQFLHGGLLHLIINCAMIWFVGRQIEETLGKAKFLSLYLIAGVFGGLLHCALTWFGVLPDAQLVNLISRDSISIYQGVIPDSLPSSFKEGSNIIIPIKVVGASAGIFGLMAAFAMMYWNRELTLLIMFILPVRMKAKFILIALAVIGVLGIISSDSGIAHGAHLGGMTWGVLYILLFVQGGTMSGAPPLWSRIREWRSSGRSRRRKVVTMDGGARTHSKGDRSINYPEEDLIKEKIDPILDKISEKGLDSLTEEEREILEEARKKMMR